MIKNSGIGSNDKFVIIVEDLNNSDDDAFPQVIGFNEKEFAFPTRQKAEEYIRMNFENRKQPFLGLTFTIVPLVSASSFTRFCSWED
jgi:hypothetical protein